MDAIEIIEALYASEINCLISTFFDEGYRAKLGDEGNGFISTAFIFDTLQEAADWLAETAIKNYPNSEFARIYDEKTYS